VAPFALMLALALGNLPGVGLPYTYRTVANTETSRSTSMDGELSVDLDGDGTDEYVCGVKTGLIVRAWRDRQSVVITQINLPPRYVMPSGRTHLGQAVDVNGDGRKDLVVTGRTESGWDQRLMVWDVFGGGMLLDLDLGAGIDAREDGRWDGQHTVLALQRYGDERRAIVARTVQYDRLERALMAIDLASGRVVWKLPTPGNVSSAFAVDVDGDGRDEVFAGMGSAGNLRPGEEVRGRLDDRALVLALSADGAVAWEREVAIQFANPQMAVMDLDGDGQTEVVVAPACSASEGDNVVRVLSGFDGGDRATYPTHHLCRRLFAWRDRATGEGRVLGAFDDHGLELFAYDGGPQLEPIAYWAPPAHVSNMIQAPGPMQEEFAFLTLVYGGRAVLLDTGLEPLAALADADPASRSTGHWNVGEGIVYIYQSAMNSGFMLEAVPPLRRYAGLAGYGAGLLLLAGGGAAGVRHRRRMKVLRRTSRLDLLRAFLTSRHGTVGPVGALERVLWAAENPDAVPREKLAESWQAGRAEAEPDLAALLEKAAHIRLDPPLLTIVRRELGAFGRHMDKAVGLEPGAKGRNEAVLAARTSFGLLADGMKSLGATLAASCRVAPAPVVDEVAARHAQRQEAVAVTVAPAPDDLPDAYADRLDLEFAVDNLLDNAVRALAGRPGAAVQVAVAVAGRRVTVTVDDNGPGVAEADRERIFEVGESSRTGGGVGLWHSRDAMRWYGGDITVDAAPEGGARFVLSLRAAD
jgi:anti-sigma regulatory factor (Ser/Thr protein kinase)